MSSKKSGCPGREVFSRMNYLYQAAALMTTSNPKLACYYGNLCKSIGKKAVLRMEPRAKRTLCKKCGIVLKPGVTADLSVVEVENKESGSPAKMLLSCNICNYRRHFNFNANYNLWLDNPKSVVETHSTASAPET